MVLDGHCRVWENVKLQPPRSPYGHLLVTAYQDPAPAQREALHGFSQQHKGNGQDYPGVR